MGPLTSRLMTLESRRGWLLMLGLGLVMLVLLPILNLAVPPGTPGGICLLRCSLSAAHTRDQIDQISGRFAKLAAALSRAEHDPAVDGGVTAMQRA